MMYVIARPANAVALGGHAFALVGYNEVGFLVQNSWGPEWGKGGFATLAYEDWLDAAYDAWVARPGVPRTPFASGRTRTALATGGSLATGPGLDKRRLAVHAVNLGNQGRLSNTGQFTSTPTQIDKIFEHMERAPILVERDPAVKRQVVLYAHGGRSARKMGLRMPSAISTGGSTIAFIPSISPGKPGRPKRSSINWLRRLKTNCPLAVWASIWWSSLTAGLRIYPFHPALDGGDEGKRARCLRTIKTWPGQWPPPPLASSKHRHLPGASLTVTGWLNVKQHGPSNVKSTYYYSAGSIFHATSA
jgi:hypothetical protein